MISAILIAPASPIKQKIRSLLEYTKRFEHPVFQKNVTQPLLEQQIKIRFKGNVINIQMLLIRAVDMMPMTAS
jgi:hypothetical protein